jgi:hypothetical protein
VPCDECRDLDTHAFRTSADLVHALQVATGEMERGVLRRRNPVEHSGAEQQALDSAMAAGAMPGAVRYQFECTVCGDQFELHADTSDGTGGWTRNDETTATR